MGGLFVFAKSAVDANLKGFCLIISSCFLNQIEVMFQFTFLSILHSLYRNNDYALASFLSILILASDWLQAEILS